MAEVTQEKSRGLRFAEEQLRRHGWEHGKGLGRAEDGIAEAIKVKVKCNKGGVGHKESEQFTFHWWDHVFNKASSRLQVASDQDGVALKKTVEEGEEDNASISNKKPRAAAARAKLYGCFVKSATLLSGQEKPEPKSADAAEDDGGSSSSSSSSSDEEDDERLDLSSTTKLSDGELMKACGGRTAHKGARHGLTMSAKLARLEQQEAEFMAKYGKKNQPQPGPAAETPPTAQATDLQEETSHDPPSKKKKKKKKKVTDEDVNAACENTDTAVKPKKKKNKAVTEEVAAATEVPEDTEKVKKKHKKKKNAVEQSGEDTERTAEKKKKKKKKSSKHQSEAAEEEQCANTESSQSEPAEGTEEEEPQSRKKRKKDQTCVRDEEEVPPKKKKKKKKSKELHL